MKWEELLDLNQINEDLIKVSYLPYKTRAEEVSKLTTAAVICLNLDTFPGTEANRLEAKKNFAVAVDLLISGAKPKMSVNDDGDLGVSVTSKKRTRPLSNVLLLKQPYASFVQSQKNDKDKQQISR